MDEAERDARDFTDGEVLQRQTSLKTTTNYNDSVKTTFFMHLLNESWCPECCEALQSFMPSRYTFIPIF